MTDAIRKQIIKALAYNKTKEEIKSQRKLRPCLKNREDCVKSTRLR